MQIDFSQDYQVWDNTQNATLIATSGDEIDLFNVAKHAITLKEAAASNGAYTTSDAIFTLPGPAVDPDFPPAAGYKLVDAAGVRWTVLETNQSDFDTVWKLTCRNLKLHFDLRDLIHYEEPVLAKDAAGAKVKAA